MEDDTRSRSPVSMVAPAAEGPGPHATLADRYRFVRQRIAHAAQRSGRTADQVILVAVTKYAGFDQIRELIELGHQDFGENQVQNLQKRVALVDEFLARCRELGGPRTANVPDRVRWHMIGHLQRNKVRKVVDLVRLIHSVDSLRLLEELHACTARREEPIEVLVQVNVAGERQKFGVAPAAVKHLVDQIDTMLGLRCRGLMCMAPIVDDPQTLRPVFERCREIFEDIRLTAAGTDRFDILSMGMSGDYEVAIECGANMVRVGSAIFGPPRAPESDEVDSGESH